MKSAHYREHWNLPTVTSSHAFCCLNKNPVVHRRVVTLPCRWLMTGDTCSTCLQTPVCWLQALCNKQLNNSNQPITIWGFFLSSCKQLMISHILHWKISVLPFQLRIFQAMSLLDDEHYQLALTAWKISTLIRLPGFPKLMDMLVSQDHWAPVSTGWAPVNNLFPLNAYR